MTPKVVNVKLAGTMLSVGPSLQFDPAKGLRRIEFRLDPASKLVWAEGNDHPNRHAFTVVQSNTKKDPLTAQPPIDGGKTLVVNNAHYDEGTAGDIVYALCAAEPIASGGFRYYYTGIVDFTQPRSGGMRPIDSPVIINKGH